MSTVVGVEDLDGLLQDLLDDLRGVGVQIEDWGGVASSVRPTVLAVCYAPSDGLAAQVFFRPLDDSALALVVANDVKRRLEAMGFLQVSQHGSHVKPRNQ